MREAPNLLKADGIFAQRTARPIPRQVVKPKLQLGTRPQVLAIAKDIGT